MKKIVLDTPSPSIRHRAVVFGEYCVASLQGQSIFILSKEGNEYIFRRLTSPQYGSCGKHPDVASAIEAEYGLRDCKGVFILENNNDLQKLLEMAR